MKKITLLCALIYVFIGAMNVLAQGDNPLAYPYYIYGEQEITGRNSSVLRNVQYNGFSTNIPVGGTNYGARNTAEKIVYQFDSIRTNPYLDITGKTLTYWRKLENGEWITDIEAGNGTATHRSDQFACFTLILDCSKSLGQSFSYVKQAALDFIDEMYSASNVGNIHIGIVCFSTMNDTQIFPITSLTESSRLQMRTFIAKQSNQRQATSMYYAIDKGIQELSAHIKGLNPKKFEGAHVITFTDGLDNTSQLENKFSLAKVSSHVKEELTTTSFHGKLIDSWVVGSQGEDVKDGQLDMMKSQLSALASNPDQFFFLEDVSMLERIFRQIANGLTKRWLSWVCTSALNHDGGVCWTLGEVPVIKEEPKLKKKHMLLGVHYAAGISCLSYASLKTGIGLDFSYPITYRFGLGAYFSGGYAYTSLGILTTIGNYNDGKAAFVGGLGMDIDLNPYWGPTMNFDLRGGVLFRNGLYMMLDMATGMTPFAMTFNIGYNFGNLFTVK